MSVKSERDSIYNQQGATKDVSTVCYSTGALRLTTIGDDTTVKECVLSDVGTCV